MIRAARVRVVNQENSKRSYLRRPIQHLIPLEVRSVCESSTEESKRSSEEPKEETPSTVEMKVLKHRYSLRSKV